MAVVKDGSPAIDHLLAFVADRRQASPAGGWAPLFPWVQPRPQGHHHKRKGAYTTSGLYITRLDDDRVRRELPDRGVAAARGAK
jgi:hypothetical protein